MQKRNRLEEIGRFKHLQHRFLFEPLGATGNLAEPTAIPVIPQIMVIRGKACRDQFKDRKQDAASIHLFEDKADRFLACGLTQRDHGQLI